MISAVANHIPDFSNLTAEISKSVSQIKEKTATLNLETSFPTAENQSNVFSNLNSYAVSYLEPQALYTVQKLASDIAQGEKLNRNQQEKNVLNEEQKEPQQTEKTENQTSFWEMLNAFEDSSLRLYGFSAYGMNVENKSNLLATMPFVQSINASYAANAYDTVANINTPPQVLIDFMHEFNRSFDYTI